MMITPYNVLRHELVGLKAKVVKSNHREYEKVSGTIVDETRNTVTVRQANKEKKIPKNSATFELAINGKAKVNVDGKLLLARPEDRVKKKIKIQFT
jgi:ribonuclease P protein subunit POP4